MGRGDRGLFAAPGGGQGSDGQPGKSETEGEKKEDFAHLETSFDWGGGRYLYLGPLGNMSGKREGALVPRKRLNGSLILMI